MTSTKIIAFLAAVADFVLGGLLSNGFITAVIITEWAKSRSLAACEQLLLSLGISNISNTFLIYLGLYNLNTTNTISNSLMLLLYQSFCFAVVFIRFWLTAWLCVFYCVKILNSTHSFFLWWKMRISRLVPRLIVGSCIVSFFASFFVVLSVSKQLQSNKTANVTNITQAGKMEDLLKNVNIFFLIIGSTCPLLIVFVCSVLVVVSLCRHACKMTSKGSNLRNLQTEAHVKAAWTVFSLLVLYISFYVVQTLGPILKFQKNLFSFVMCFIVLLMYSPVQAAILVLSNPKLKQTALRMIHLTYEVLYWIKHASLS
uniref:Taste receptor type 2 n=1 Tax=Salvator merianae TaxID=96440 RepID=A0A8D0BLL4_SALMN